MDYSATYSKSSFPLTSAALSFGSSVVELCEIAKCEICVVCTDEISLLKESIWLHVYR